MLPRLLPSILVYSILFEHIVMDNSSCPQFACDTSFGMISPAAGFDAKYKINVGHTIRHGKHLLRLTAS